MRQAESGQRRASLAGFKLVSYANVEDSFLSHPKAI